MLRLDGPGNSVSFFHCAFMSFRNLLSSISMFIFKVYLIFGQVVYTHDAVFTVGKRISIKKYISPLEVELVCFLLSFDD